jgi:ferredoxin
MLQWMPDVYIAALQATWFSSLMALGYAVEPERCLGCGSCAIIAPEVFAVIRRVRLVRQPATESETTACAAAALVCPTQAIRMVPRE